MADTHDTIDGLLAEFRGYSAGMPPSYHVTMSWHDFRVMLDRIEAAYRRERGDRAKLREALMEIRDICLRVGANISPTSKKYQSRECQTIFACFRKAADALAAPPRNCDRFGGDIDKLREACARERGLNPEENFPDVFPDWLLATATEKEGGAK